VDRSFYRFVTIHACDRRTDGRTEFSSQYRVCITCSAVKMVNQVTKFSGLLLHLYQMTEQYNVQACGCDLLYRPTTKFLFLLLNR